MGTQSGQEDTSAHTTAASTQLSAAQHSYRAQHTAHRTQESTALGQPAHRRAQHKHDTAHAIQSSSTREPVIKGWNISIN